MKTFLLARLPLLLVLLIPGFGGAAEITRGPYLQLATPQGISIVWRTDGPIDSPAILLGKAPDTLHPIASEIRQRTTGSEVEPLAKSPGGTVQHEARITGLDPNTHYYYQITADGKPLSEAGEAFSLRTQPEPGTSNPTRIWVVGDSGTGTLHQMLVHKAMRKFTETTSRPLDLYLHVGDMAYGNGSDEQFQERFFEPYQQTLQETVCWPTIGNHEARNSDSQTGIGPYYDSYLCPTKGEAGGVPSGTEAYYSFDQGDIHIICLESDSIDRKPGAPMATWLRADLEKSSSSRWRLAFWHHPPYSKGTHDSDRETQLIEMRELIMPILEEHGIDLVLCGHSHIYERSMLIDGAYATPTTAEGVILDDGDGDPEGDGPYRKSDGLVAHNGTIALVTGHGGALGKQAKGIMPVMRSLVLDHGSTILDFDGDTLTGTMLDLRGTVRDRFAIRKEGKVTHEVIPAPWQPTEADLERTGANVAGPPAPRSAVANWEEKTTPVIARKANWQVRVGPAPTNSRWAEVGFDASGWEVGKAGFGYGDKDDATVLDSLRGTDNTVQIRHEFNLPPGADPKKLALAIRYDDAFDLLLNGRPLLSRGVERDASGKVSKITSHEAGDSFELIPLGDHASALLPGRNCLALQGHNVSTTSSDLTLDPALVLVP